MNRATFDRLRGLQLENEGHAALMATMRPRFAQMAARHENGTAPRAVSAYQLFQTPAEIAERMALMIPVCSGSRILEPSAGLGRILDALTKRGAGEIVAVEMAAECAGELFRQDRPHVKIVQRDFLACTPQEFGLFNAVAMNPPFHMRADIRHILHARTFLKDGGKLVALCLNTPQREDALRPLAEVWEPLPVGTFAKEGTHVSTVLLTING